MDKIMWKCVKFPVFGERVLLPWLIKREGGQKESRGLRAYVLEKYSVDIGMYSYGSCFENEFNVGGNVAIGRYCSFAMGVHYFGANHPISHAVMSPYFYNKSFGFDVMDVERKKLIIGHDVWIGANAIITNKCSCIGNGAAVAAGTVVTKDVPSYAIVAGNPAKILRYRFDFETIEALEQSKWWELTPIQLMKYYECIENPLIWANEIARDKQNDCI